MDLTEREEITMSIFLKVVKWLFSNPTAIIALMSMLIALLAYKHQRKSTRKQNAVLTAEKYAREMLPRMRYIYILLDRAMLITTCNKFTDFRFFTEKELHELLLKAETDEAKFKTALNGLKKENLNDAIAFSGGSEYIHQQHLALLEIADNTPNILGTAATRFIKDFLNDMEAMATLLRYNIADEKLIYQSLHQTYLKYMKYWYFFISDENRKDQDRFYSNTIWLYNHWSKRKNKDEIVIDRVLALTTKARKL